MKCMYSRFHSMCVRNLYLITIAEGMGTEESPIHETTYVGQKNEDGNIEIIGELYENN